MNKIRLSVIITFSVVFLIFSFGMLSLLKSDLLEIFNQQKLESLRKTVWVLPDSMKSIRKEIIELQGFRLTFMDKNGEVLYDTQKDYSDNLLYKKEIKDGIAIRKDGEKYYIYAAKPLKEGFVRLGLEENNLFLSFLNHDFYRYSALGILILVLAALFLTEKILVPIKEILRFSHSFKNGNYNARIYVEGSKDMEVLSRSLNQMAQTIEYNHQELKLRQEMIESVIKNFPLGIALLDNKGRLEVYNPKLEILLNQSLVLKRIYYENFFHSQIIEILRESYESKNDVSQKIPMVNMDRNAIYEIFCHYIDGNVILAVTDITEKEKLNQLKSQFISDVTHEFKTPISIILGYLEVLEEKMDEKGRYYIEKSKNSLHRLTEIINDLVKLERIEYSNLFGGFKEIRVKDIIEKSLETLMPFAEKKNIEVKTVYESKNLKTHGVEEILYYCVYNLIENSMKYNDKEKGLLKIHLKEEHQKIVLNISDNGPGIAPEYREDIFRRFFRISKSRTHSAGQGGSGLGLSIVREGVKFHKGTVICRDTEDGLGICFELSLPKI